MSNIVFLLGYDLTWFKHQMKQYAPSKRVENELQVSFIAQMGFLASFCATGADACKYATAISYPSCYRSLSAKFRYSIHISINKGPQCSPQCAVDTVVLVVPRGQAPQFWAIPT